MALVYMNLSDKFKTSTVTIMHSPHCARSEFTGWWYTYPSEKYESVGIMTFPIYMESHKSHVPNHQAVVVSLLWHIIIPNELGRIPWGKLSPFPASSVLWASSPDVFPLATQSGGTSPAPEFHHFLWTTSPGRNQYLGLSKIGGIPKWMLYNGTSY